MSSNDDQDNIMLNILIEGDINPIGFIEVTNRTTLAEARKLIDEEVDDVPDDYFFLLANDNAFVKVSKKQESKKRAIDYGKGKILIRDSSRATIRSRTQTPALDTSDLNSTLSSSAPSFPNPRAQSPPTTPASSTLHRLESISSPRPERPSDFPTNFNLRQLNESSALDLLPDDEPVLQINNNNNNNNNQSEKSSLSDKIESSQANQGGVDVIFSEMSDPLESFVLPQTPTNPAGWGKLWDQNTIKERNHVLDEVPFVILKILGEEPDLESHKFKALNALVLNVGPSVYGTNEATDLWDDPKEVFIRIMRTFAPLEGFLDRVTNTLRKGYFFGNISSKKAEQTVINAENGTFLVRLSNSQPGSFALTVKSGQKIFHYCIDHSDTDFRYQLGKNSDDSLDAVINKSARLLNLRKTPDTPPFEKVFSAPISGTHSYSNPVVLSNE